MALEYDREHRGAGFLLTKEVNFFSKVLEKPARPFIAVVGGSKVSGKLQALNKLIQKVDKLIIGGGMAFTFLKAQGYEVGNSLVEDNLINDARTIMYKAKKNKVKFYLPVDVVVAPEFDEHTTIKYLPTQEIPEDWMGLDIGAWLPARLFREALKAFKIGLATRPIYWWDIGGLNWGGSGSIGDEQVLAKKGFLLTTWRST